MNSRPPTKWFLFLPGKRYVVVLLIRCFTMSVKSNDSPGLTKYCNQIQTDSDDQHHTYMICLLLAGLKADAWLFLGS